MKTYFLVNKEDPDDSIVIKASSLIEAFKDLLKKGSCMAWCLEDFESDDIDFCAKEIYLFVDWEDQDWIVFEFNKGVLNCICPLADQK